MAWPRKIIAFIATIPLGWCIREVTKTAIFDWVTRRLEGIIGIEEAEVIAFCSTYAVPLVIAIVIVGFVYWLARGDRRTTRTTIWSPYKSSSAPKPVMANRSPTPDSVPTSGNTQSLNANLAKLFAVEDKAKLLYLKYLPDNPDKRAFDTMLALLFGYKEIYGRDEIRKSVMNESLQKSRLKRPVGSEWLSSIASGPLDFYDSDEIYSAGRDSYKYDNDQYIEKGSLSKGGAFKLTADGYERARSIVEDLIERG